MTVPVFPRFLLQALLISLVLFEGESVAAAQQPSCEVATEAFAAAQEIRGLKAKRQVPCVLQEKEQVLAFLSASVKKKIPQKKLDGEERIYKALGLVPDNFDYVQELLKLYSEQAGGYYDPDSKRYVMAAWIPSMLQPTVAAHELTHALQDQYYNLEHFMDDAAFSGDELLAHSALVEGDATAVMNDFQLGARGRSAVAQMPTVEPIILQTVLGSYLTQSTAAEPEVIKNMMIFPYTSGLRFVHFFLKKGGYKMLDGVFRLPPHSSSEILHPELYPQPAASMAKEILAGALKGDTAEYQDVMGEFFMSSWLSIFLKDKAHAATVAAGLLNDVAMVTPLKKVVWVTQWRTPGAEQEFLKSVQSLIEVRKNVHVHCEDAWRSCTIEAQ